MSSDPVEIAERCRPKQQCKALVRASRLHVAGLLALVAHTLTLGLSRAVARNVANLAA
jgi:hypothetical protein